MHDIDRIHYLGPEQSGELADGESSDGSSWSIGSLLGAGRQIARQGADWAIIQFALSRGERDENRITDLLFNDRHPERGGRPIQAGEQQLAREWLELRERLVRPALRAGAGPAAPGPAAPGPAGGPPPAAQPPAPQPVPAGSQAALDALRPLVGSSTQPTMANMVAILRAVSTYWNVPWQLPFTILEHEGGLRLFQHPDGAMQTIRSARDDVLPRLPRPLKLLLLGLPAGEPTSDAALAGRLEQEFHRSLATQIVAGTQELVTNLQRTNGYVALAFVGYNAGYGSAYWVATGRSPRAKPRITGDAWEQACRVGATLLHQPRTAVNVQQGVWQCDKNLAVRGQSGWFAKYSVRDRKTGRLLIAYQYLRSVLSCIRETRPGVPCGPSNHGPQYAQPGSGRTVCKDTRPGALDKLYDPARFGSPYRQIAQAEFRSIPDDGAPIKVVDGRLTKMAPAAP